MDVDVAGLLARAAADPAFSGEFIAALLPSTVSLLGTVGAGGGFAPVGFTDADDMTSVVFYLGSPDLEKLRPRFGDGSGALVLRQLQCETLFAMAVERNTATILNLYLSPGKAFTVREMSDILARRAPGLAQVTMAANTQVAVGLPAYVPDDLAPALIAFFSARPSVQKLQLGWIRYPDGAQGYLLVVTSDEAQDMVMSGFGHLNIGALIPGRTIDVTVASTHEPQRSALAEFPDAVIWSRTGR